jgi:hypothetical protein
LSVEFRENLHGVKGYFNFEVSRENSQVFDGVFVLLTKNAVNRDFSAEAPQFFTPSTALLKVPFKPRISSW